MAISCMNLIKQYFFPDETIYSKKEAISTIDGKIIELNIDVLSGKYKQWIEYARILFSKPMYFDANGKKVKNHENYETIKIDSKMLIVDSNITGLMYLNKLQKAYNLSIEKNEKDIKGNFIVDLSDLCPSHNKLHILLPKDCPNYLEEVIEINKKMPFLSLKINK
ncbi:MAG: hypothetical protein PHN56_03410 [Candidatus Nanoarchaeia archaeon]|nr:hypothetical protein [Candidatus Nanoarchaeia archaeon]